MASGQYPDPTLLNQYILDYLRKRKYNQTAQLFLQEAGIPNNLPPVADAPGGFLLEWWALFWDIFKARLRRPTTDHARAYYEYTKTRSQYSARNSQMGMQMAHPAYYHGGRPTQPGAYPGAPDKSRAHMDMGGMPQNAYGAPMMSRPPMPANSYPPGGIPQPPVSPHPQSPNPAALSAAASSHNALRASGGNGGYIPGYPQNPNTPTAPYGNWSAPTSQHSNAPSPGGPANVPSPSPQQEPAQKPAARSNFNKSQETKATKGKPKKETRKAKQETTSNPSTPNASTRNPPTPTQQPESPNVYAAHHTTPGGTPSNPPLNSQIAPIGQLPNTYNTRGGANFPQFKPGGGPAGPAGSSAGGAPYGVPGAHQAHGVPHYPHQQMHTQHSSSSMMSQQQTIPNQMMGAPSGHGSMSSYSSSGMLPSDPSGSTSSSYGGSDAPVVDSLAGAPLKTSTGRRMSGTQELLMKINSQKNGMPEGPSPMSGQHYGPGMYQSHPNMYTASNMPPNMPGGMMGPGSQGRAMPPTILNEMNDPARMKRRPQPNDLVEQYQNAQYNKMRSAGMPGGRVLPPNMYGVSPGYPPQGSLPDSSAYQAMYGMTQSMGSGQPDLDMNSLSSQNGGNPSAGLDVNNSLSSYGLTSDFNNTAGSFSFEPDPPLDDKTKLDVADSFLNMGDDAADAAPVTTPSQSAAGASSSQTNGSSAASSGESKVDLTSNGAGDDHASVDKFVSSSANAGSASAGLESDDMGDIGDFPGLEAMN